AGRALDGHDLGRVQHRQDDLAGEGDVDLADLGDDEGLALFHLAEQLRDDEQGDEYEQQADADDCGDARGGCIHGTRPWELGRERVRWWSGVGARTGTAGHGRGPEPPAGAGERFGGAAGARLRRRGREIGKHTSELQSRENLVCRLLLEKKKALVSESNAV